MPWQAGYQVQLFGHSRQPQIPSCPLHPCFSCPSTCYALKGLVLGSFLTCLPSFQYAVFTAPPPLPPPPSLHAALRVIFSPSVHLWLTGAEILNVFFFVAGWSPNSSVFDYKAFHDLTPVTFPAFPLTASAPLP